MKFQPSIGNRSGAQICDSNLMYVDNEYSDDENSAGKSSLTDNIKNFLKNIFPSK